MHGLKGVWGRFRREENKRDFSWHLFHSRYPACELTGRSLDNPSIRPRSTRFVVLRGLRDYIFRLALTTPYDVEVLAGQQRDSPDRYYHRRRTNTALLRTCRLFTTRPPSNRYPSILTLSATPDSFSKSTIATSHFKRMTSAQLAAVQHIHIFAKRSCITAEDPGRYISYSAFAELGCLRGKKIGERRDTCGIGGPYPKKMKITIRKRRLNILQLC